MLPGNETDPGGEVLSGSESRRICDRGSDCRRPDDADAGNTLKSPGDIARAVLGVDAAIKLTDLLLKRTQLVEDRSERMSHRLR